MRRHAVPLMLLFFMGCGGPMGETAAMDVPAEAAFVAGGHGAADITWQSTVVTLEQDAGLASLRGESTDGRSLLFDPAVEALRVLAAGDVFVIKGVLARKVIAAEVIDGDLLVVTEPAGLGDVVADGTIAIEAPVRFSEALAGAETEPGLLSMVDLLTVPLRAAAQSVPKMAAKNVFSAMSEGWRHTFSATPGPGRVGIALQASKDVGGFRALIKGDGYLADFDMSAGIDVQRGVVERLELAHKKLNGLMNFTWEVAKQGPGVINDAHRMKLPAAISIPLWQYLGGLPLFLEVSAAIIIEPAMSGGGEYSRGAFRITYDGYQNFRAKAGNIDAEGQVTGDIQWLEGQNISPLAPHGIVTAFAAPRIELSLGLTKLLKFGDMAKAAGYVDTITEQLLKRKLAPADYARWKASPLGTFGMGKAVAMAMKSDAAAYIELVTSSGTSFSGISAIFPCTRTDINLWAKVGTSATAFGQKVGQSEKELWRKDFSRVDPPTAGLCK